MRAPLQGMEKCADSTAYNRELRQEKAAVNL